MSSHQLIENSEQTCYIESLKLMVDVRCAGFHDQCLQPYLWEDGAVRHSRKKRRFALSCVVARPLSDLEAHGFWAPQSDTIMRIIDVQDWITIWRDSKTWRSLYSPSKSPGKINLQSHLVWSLWIRCPFHVLGKDLLACIPSFWCDMISLAVECHHWCRVICRRIILLVKAGSAVDATIATLVPLLEEGDQIIDGGNEWSVL